MHMTITLTDVTTDNALKLLSALEFADLIQRDTTTSVASISMDAQDAVTVADAYVRSLASVKDGNPSQNETTPATPAFPQDAGDCDLFVDDVAGFHVQRALDAWVQGRYNRSLPLNCPLPVVGRTTPSNLVTIAEAQRILDWPVHSLYNFVYTQSVDFVRANNAYKLTREQVAILKLAKAIADATGRSRMGSEVFRQATRAFLAAFPVYTAQMRRAS